MLCVVMSCKFVFDRAKFPSHGHVHDTVSPRVEENLKVGGTRMKHDFGSSFSETLDLAYSISGIRRAN